MPADPILNEQGVIDCLDGTHGMSTGGLRKVCNYALMCARDRGVQREFFGTMLDIVSAINEHITGAETGVKMRQLACALDPERAMPDFDTLVNEHFKALMGQQKLLREKMILVSQCPTTSDKVS